MSDAIAYQYNCFVPFNRRPTSVSPRLREEQPDQHNPKIDRIISNATYFFMPGARFR